MVVRFVGVIRVPLCARECLLEITHRYTFTFTQAIHTRRRVPPVSPCVCPGSPKVFLFTRSRSFYIFTGKKTPGGAGTHTRQTQEPHKPTSKPTPPTDSRARPHPNPGTHASHHTTPLTRKRGGGDGDGDGARTWEQRGREPDGIGDGTPPRTGRHGGKRLRHPRAADRAHGSCPAARTGHDYARCAAREAEDRKPHGVAARPIAGPARLSRWGP